MKKQNRRLWSQAKANQYAEKTTKKPKKAGRTECKSDATMSQQFPEK